MRIEFSLPWPPSANSCYRSFNNRVIKSIRYREFELAVVRQVLVQKIPRDWTEARLAVAIVCCAPTHRRYDLDNRLKPTLDALQVAKVISDDETIDQLTIGRGPKMKGGKLLVVIEEWSDLPPEIDLSKFELSTDASPQSTATVRQSEA